MAMPVEVGTAVAVPGTLQYGRWQAISHPTGNEEFLPVIIAQGEEPGPCLWLTAGIHGPEHSGPLVIYDLLTEVLVKGLRGTVVAISALSPAGLRTREREPYHSPVDPNRLWPDGREPSAPDPDTRPPSSLERAFGRLFELIKQSADYLIDFHNAWVGSIPYVFQDRVLYRPDEGKKGRQAAEALSARQYQMVSAYGHTIVREYPADIYIEKNLHRSTSGAVLLVGRIPAITVELGGGLVPDLSIVGAAAAGTRNVLRWAGMLDGDPEPVVGVPVVDPGFPVRLQSTPRAPEACIVRHQVEAGDVVQAGDPIAQVMDVWGRPLGAGWLLAEQDGIVMGRPHGIYFYPGEPVLYMAVRDDAPLVAPYPEDFFRAAA